MKRFSYIPLLTLVAVLSSCSASNLKAPSFDKEGSEVTSSDFASRYLEAVRDSELNDSSITLGDRSMKYSYSSYHSLVVKRDSKDAIKNEVVSTAKGENQYDYDSLVGKSVNESKEVGKGNDEESTTNYTQEFKQEYYYQMDFIDHNSGLLCINNKTKHYYLLDGSGANATVFDRYVKESLKNVFSAFDYYYNNLPNKDVLYYINNDKIFTCSISKQEDKTNGAYKLKRRIKIKIQVDLTDKKQAARVSYEESQEKNYTSAEGEYLKGDYVTEESKQYVDYSISANDISLSKISLTGYTH